MVVELIKQWLESATQVGEIHHPTAVLARFATDPDFDPERVAMHTFALMTIRHIGQEMRCLDLEYTKYVHVGIVQSAGNPRKSRQW